MSSASIDNVFFAVLGLALVFSTLDPLACCLGIAALLRSFFGAAAELGQ